MTKLRDIVLDGIILFTVSTAVVVAANYGAKKLEGSSKRESPLIAAIDKNDLKGLREKLSGGAGADQPDAQGRTPLAWAAYANLENAETLAETDKKRVEMVTALLAKGADPNTLDQDGWTPLMWASWSGLEACADTLMSSGARCDMYDKRGYSALVLAASRGFPGIVRSILAQDSSGREEAREAAAAAMLNHPGKKEAYEEVLGLLGN